MEAHADHFPPDTPDAEWLAEVGRRGWLVITKDKHIRYRTAERQALLEAGVRAFVLTATGLSGEENAAALVRALPRMVRFAAGHHAPFIASVSRSGAVAMLYQPPRHRRLSPPGTP